MQGLAKQLVRIRQQSQGVYSAEAVGLPDIQATAGSSEEAIREGQYRLEQGLSSGQLVQIELCPVAPAPRNSNDPLEREFLEDLEREHREDLERTLKEYDQQCSDSSSIRTT